MARGEISEATGTRAVRQRSTSGEHSPVRQYGFSSCLPRSKLVVELTPLRADALEDHPTASQFFSSIKRRCGPADRKSQGSPRLTPGVCGVPEPKN